MRQQAQVTGLAATMTIVAMGMGSAVVIGDLAILSVNLAAIQRGLQSSGSTTIFVASLAALTLGATVLGAGVLGAKYGMKRMFVAGACGSVVFGFLAATAPNAAVLMIARACIGVAFAFMSGLSLAIINAAFPPDRRAGAIARYLAAVYAFGVVPPAVGSKLVEHIGWRSGFLVTPVLALIVVTLTVRYVPETQRTPRKTDITGLLLVAGAVVGLIYGVSQLQNGLHVPALAPILLGILAATAFLWWERRADEPALDLRLFRSPRFNAAVTVGAANSLVQGAAMLMVTYYLVIVRDTSTETFALMLVPATLLSALATLGAGRASAQFGQRAVLVAGLTVLTLSLLLRRLFEVNTPIVAVAAVMALTAIGGAIIQTPQATIMMSSAPTNLGGVVSAVKTSVAGFSYSLGSALVALLGVSLFNRDAHLASSGISSQEARDTLRVTNAAIPGAPGDLTFVSHTQWVISEATSSMLATAHKLNLIMALVPVTAIVLALMLLRREPTSTARGS